MTIEPMSLTVRELCDGYADHAEDGVVAYGGKLDIRPKYQRLMVYLCDGSDSEKLEWFRTINIAGEELTDQELRNAVYAWPWTADAKRHFSKLLRLYDRIVIRRRR